MCKVLIPAERLRELRERVLSDGGIHCHISQIWRYRRPVGGKHETAVRQGVYVNVAEIWQYGDLETKLRNCWKKLQNGNSNLAVATQQLKWTFENFAKNNVAVIFLKCRWDFKFLAVHDKNNLAALLQALFLNGVTTVLSVKYHSM